LAVKAEDNSCANKMNITVVIFFSANSWSLKPGDGGRIVIVGVEKVGAAVLSEKNGAKDDLTLLCSF